MITALLAAGVAGLAALPHCAAMCGPVGAAACRGLDRRRAVPAYLVARLVGYVAVGAVAGAIGQRIVGALGTRGASIAAATTLALGLLIAALRTWPRADARASKLVQLRTPSSPSRSAPRWAPGAMGGVTALLPCGASLAAYVIAAGSGSAVAGGASMAVFALASSPALFLVARAASFLERAGGRGGRMAVASFLALGALVVGLRPLAAPEGGACHGEHGTHAPAPAGSELEP